MKWKEITPKVVAEKFLQLLIVCLLSVAHLTGCESQVTGVAPVRLAWRGERGRGWTEDAERF